MARRRSGLSKINEFLDGFNGTYQTVNKVVEDKRLNDIAQEQPIDQAPVDEVDHTDTGLVKRNVSPRQTNYLGQTYDHPLTEEEKLSLRNNAMADVVGRRDPLGAQRLRQEGFQTLSAGRRERREADTEKFNKDFGGEVGDIVGGQGLTPRSQGAMQPGNIDLSNRPQVKNPDGSTSTVRSISVGFDDGTYLLPTVTDDGRVVSNEEAIANFKRTGKHLGRFESEEAANTYAQRLHEQQAAQYGLPAEPPGPGSTSGVGETVAPRQPAQGLRTATSAGFATEGGLDGMANRYRGLLKKAATSGQLQAATPQLSMVKQSLRADYLRDKVPGENASLNDYQNYMRESAKFDAAFGDPLTPEEALKGRETFKRFRQEGYTDALNAIDRGDIEEANRHGSQGGLNWTVLGARKGTWSLNGVPVPTTFAKVKMADGTTREINTAQMLFGAQTFAERTKQGFDAFKTDADVKQSKASAASSYASARSHNVTADNAELETAGREAYGLMQRDPDATLTPLQRRGLDFIQGSVKEKQKGEGYKVEANEVSSALGTPAVDPDTKQPMMDPMTGRQMVNRNPQAEEEFWRFMDQNGLKDTNEALFKFKAMKSRQSAPGLPEGANQIGTSGGKAVYQLPSGKRVVER